MKTEFYNRFVKAKQFTDQYGEIYGTEDFAIYLYSVIKMLKPNTVVELGTGLGTTMIWAALALEENQQGTLITVDDGSEWPKINSAVNLNNNYKNYIENLIQEFELKSVDFRNQKIKTLDIDSPIDILFCDYAHSVYDVCQLLSEYLPLMNTYSKIYIDSASTHYNSYNALERIVELFNQGHIPQTVKDLSLQDLEPIVKTHRFDLEHIIENKNRNQNSTACVTISPVDIFAYPRVNIRSV
jgi:predicted O-methyltransferase YrrM